MAGGDTKLVSKADGFGLGVHHVEAEGERRGGLVLIQEIFGVNANIRAVAADFAAEGFEVIAPSLYDRVEPGFLAGYDQEGMEKAFGAAGATDFGVAVQDIQTCIDQLEGPVFLVGFCWGGTAAWIAAAKCTGLAAVSSFYGHAVSEHLKERPKVPTILHYGLRDPYQRPEQIEAIEKAHPEVRVFTYDDAGHGFFSDRRVVGGDEELVNAHHEESAQLAKKRTLELFKRYDSVIDWADPEWAPASNRVRSEDRGAG